MLNGVATLDNANSTDQKIIRIIIVVVTVIIMIIKK